MSGTLGGECPLEQATPDPGGLGVGEHEELGQLANAVAYDRSRIPDGSAGRLVLGDPPQVACRGEMVEQRTSGLERRRITSGRVRVAASAPAEVVDRRLEDLEAGARVGGCAGSIADHRPSVAGHEAHAILGPMADSVTTAADEALEVPLSAIEDAAGRLDGYVHRTPILSSRTAAAWAERATGAALADGLLYLKAEHLQKTGSFKARGMTNRVATLPEDARGRGAITLSAGNAGQAYAWAGAASGVPVTVVMPEGAVRSKVDACIVNSSA